MRIVQLGVVALKSITSTGVQGLQLNAASSHGNISPFIQELDPHLLICVGLRNSITESSRAGSRSSCGYSGR
jgi:hypothetical protein